MNDLPARFRTVATMVGDLQRVLLSRASDLRRSCPVYVRGAGDWRDGVPRVLLSRASDLRRSCLLCVCAVCIVGFALYEKNVHQPWPLALKLLYKLLLPGGPGAKAALGRPAQMGEASERSVLNGSSS